MTPGGMFIADGDVRIGIKGGTKYWKVAERYTPYGIVVLWSTSGSYSKSELERALQQVLDDFGKENGR